MPLHFSPVVLYNKYFYLIFCQKLQGIPTSAFYTGQDKKLAENLIRFCFIKKDETLGQAEAILNKLNESLAVGDSHKIKS